MQVIISTSFNCRTVYRIIISKHTKLLCYGNAKYEYNAFVWIMYVKKIHLECMIV